MQLASSRADADLRTRSSSAPTGQLDSGFRRMLGVVAVQEFERTPRVYAFNDQVITGATGGCGRRVESA